MRFAGEAKRRPAQSTATTRRDRYTDVMSSSKSERVRRAGAIGSRVALGIAVLTGGVLLGAASGARGLQLAVAATTLVVAAFAWSAGATAGRAIDRHGHRGLLAALAIGIAGGSASLLVASVTGAVAGAAWGLWDHHTFGADFVWSYLGKPALAVLLYGVWIATVLGAIGGAIIYVWNFQLLRRPRP